MGELKHGFGAAKMNKDADERIVPSGEYRDALNIEILTSEGSDTGAMQTLLGNSNITNSQITASISSNAKCVGSIADEKNNNLYYFIADNDRHIDYIFQYNSDSGVLLPVVVDKYNLNVMITTASTTSSSNINTSFIISDLGAVTDENLTNVRPGMIVSGATTGNDPLNAVYGDGIIVIRLEKITNGWQVFVDETTANLNIFNNGFSSNQLDVLNFQTDRVLNFKSNQITGINIIDGIIYWTDGKTEPKKIIVNNFLKNNLPGKGGTTVCRHS